VTASVDVPALEADAHVEHVPTQPQSTFEYGSWTFTRDLAHHIGRLLHLPVGQMLIRSNPWDRRPCPKVSVYDLTFGEHRILITNYETTHPLIRGPIDTYAILVDDQPVPFERTTYADPLEWQLARTIWIAVTDRQIAAERATRDAGQVTP
jgi:hypothetical protein